MRSTGDPDERWYDEDAGPLVRPYALTRPDDAADRPQLDLITVLVARVAAPPATPLFPEQAQIVELCRRPLSVAEVGAHLDLPLGTVRVLLGELLQAGLIETHVSPALSELPSPELLRAMLTGLQEL
ncbi:MULTISPECIES: DUF742 domain-containing protein [unclassified Micromonospora]|uniref:DUF742 domain-containing protein n=1 Tax=unclassified Micromonospora TaxID=2617518 RepID=UPI002FF2DF0F